MGLGFRVYPLRDHIGYLHSLLRRTSQCSQKPSLWLLLPGPSILTFNRSRADSGPLVPTSATLAARERQRSTPLNRREARPEVYTLNSAPFTPAITPLT